MTGKRHARRHIRAQREYAQPAADSLCPHRLCCPLEQLAWLRQLDGHIGATDASGTCIADFAALQTALRTG